MKLSELIAKHGDEDVQIQNIDAAVSRMNWTEKSGHTTASLHTDQPFDGKGFKRLGMIVWLDREKVAEIIAEEKNQEPKQ